MSLSRSAQLERARMHLAQAVTRSTDDDWLGTDHHLAEARRYLRNGSRDDLVTRVIHARSVGATTVDARKEMREVMQLIDADDAIAETMAETGTQSFATMEISQ